MCFKCGERWGQDHICKLKHFQIMLVEDSEEEFPIEGEEEIVPEAQQLEMRSLHVSFNSLKGFTSNKSFKVWGN